MNVTVCFGDLGRGTCGKRSIDQDSLYTENIWTNFTGNAAVKEVRVILFLDFGKTLAD